MNKLSDKEILDLLGEMMVITTELTEIKNPFVQVKAMQSKYSIYFQKIHSLGFERGVKVGEKREKESTRITKSN